MLLTFILDFDQAKDQEGRTPLHYAAALHDSGIFYRYLLKCGADELIQDKYAKTAKHYVYAPQDIDLNSLVRRCQEMPRKREPTEKKQYVIPTSSPSPMDTSYTPALVKGITTSNIRNWIRTADLDSLEMVVLEGQGHKLLSENASDNKVRQFLKSVPGYIVSKYFDY